MKKEGKSLDNITIENIQDQIKKLIIRVENLEDLKKKDLKIKTKKDPNEPKKNVSNYFHFLKEFRKEYLISNPKINVIDISKKAGEEWNNIKSDPRKKKKYDDMAVKDKNRYNKEMEKYNQRNI